MQTHLHLGYAFTVSAPFETSFALLSDVPASASHFPGLRRLVPLGREHGRSVYRWELQAVGPAAHLIETVYACRYTSHKGKGLVRWEPVEGVGNARVWGSWQLNRERGHTALELDLEGLLELPLPPLVRTLVEPVVQAEFESLVEAYIDGLIETLGGEIDT